MVLTIRVWRWARTGPADDRWFTFTREPGESTPEMALVGTFGGSKERQVRRPRHERRRRTTLRDLGPQFALWTVSRTVDCYRRSRGISEVLKSPLTMCHFTFYSSVVLHDAEHTDLRIWDYALV